MKIQYLSHTADIRMKIEAATLQELFIAGTKGMNTILKKGFCNQNNQLKQKARIEIQSLDYTCLLIDFLSEVLSLSYVEKAIFCKAQILKFSKYKILAEVLGDPIDYFEEEIKAVTYHEANVQKNDNNEWETCIIFDI
ncbi:MAG: archease [Bacteroidetes bacterium]|nr:archease [Bacteroidota bacterium]